MALLETAAEGWASPGEPLLTRAKRLGWVNDAGRLAASPVPRRARARAATGLSIDEQARLARLQRIPAGRRRELDALADTIANQLADDTERRYLIERLVPRPGRPASPDGDRAAWRRDAERANWDASALAETWGLSRRGAFKRLAELRG